MFRRFDTYLWLAGALVVGACGGGDLSYEEAFEEGVQVVCSKTHECRDTFPGTDEDFQDFFSASETACVDAGLEDGAPPAPLRASIEAGRVEYNSDDARECLNYLASLSCDEWWDTEVESPAACETAFQGTVPDGGDCTIDQDCEGSDAICDGTCTL